MKKRNIKKNIILILLLNLFSINVYSVYAETFNQNGLTFTKGEHKPDKRVYKKKVIPKNPKVLEVIIRPEHGRDLKPEEMENYVPTNKILVGEDNLEEVFTEVNREKYPLELKSGAHVTVGGVWTNASSRELKENISDIDGLIGLSTVLKLKPVTYNYKIQPGETYAGFIAEDVPDIVSTSDRKSLSPMDVVAVVVGAIQEIWHKITSILDRLDRIENKLGIQNIDIPVELESNRETIVEVNESSSIEDTSHDLENTETEYVENPASEESQNENDQSVDNETTPDTQAESESSNIEEENSTETDIQTDGLESQNFDNSEVDNSSNQESENSETEETDIENSETETNTSETTEEDNQTVADEASTDENEGEESSETETENNQNQSN